MTKVVAIMSMSLDGYVADANDGVAEADRVLGDVEVATASTTSGMTFHVQPRSADHPRGLTTEVGAMLTGRRTFEVAEGWGGQHPWETSRFRRHPPGARRLATARLDSPVRHRRHRKRRCSSESGCRPEVRGSARCRDDPAVPERRSARRDPHRSGCCVARRRSAAIRPPSRTHRPSSGIRQSSPVRVSRTCAIPCTRRRPRG